MKRVAALDCGTNTLRLLVADLDAGTGEVVPVERRSTIVRLGQGVDRTGAFAPAALERTFATLDEYVAIVASLEVDAVRFVATSAARDVSNRETFLAGVRDRVGVQAEIISGDEEARLAYDGATRQLRGRSDVATPVLVLDIGGGSTELVMRSPSDDTLQGVSLDVGSVRLTERHLHSDPPSRPEVEAAVADVEAALGAVELPLEQAGSLVGVAGTVTTMAALVLDPGVFDPDRVNLARLPAGDVLSAVDRVVAMTVAERLSVPYMKPGRADVIAAGALVLGCVLRRAGTSSLVVSTHDILDGIAWTMA